MATLTTELGRGWDESKVAGSIVQVARGVAAKALNAAELDAKEPIVPVDGWELAIEAGWHRALIPESHGGAQLDFPLLAPIAEALAVASGYPAFAATAVDAVWLLHQCGTAEAEGLLAAIAAGDARPVLDWGSAPDGDDRRKSGLILVAAGGAPPSVLRCVVDDGGVPAGASRVVESLDPAAWESTLALGAALDAAALVGIGRQALSLTLEHARERVQFDQPIGAFQAVQHHCVAMYLLIEQARVLANSALRSMTDEPTLTREVMFAKVKASEMAIEALRKAHRIHGGIGYYADYPLAALTRSALAIRGMHGSPTSHRARLRALLQESPEAFSHARSHVGGVPSGASR